MAAAVPIAMVAGTMIQSYAQSSAASNREAAMADEARTSEMNAIYAGQARDYNANRQQLIAGQRFGEMKAGFAASGVSSDSESVLQVMRQSHVNAELDRQNILFNGDVNVYNNKNRAEAARGAGSRAHTAGNINTFATMFGGFGKMGAYYGGQSNLSNELDSGD